MLAHLPFVISLALLAQVPESVGITEVGRRDCAITGAQPLTVTIVEQSETVGGGARPRQEPRWQLLLAGRTALELDDPHLTIACEDGAVAITWRGGEDAATVRLTSNASGALVVEPGLQKSLERAWSEGDGMDFGALWYLLQSMPAALRPEAAVIELARLVAARQALARENFLLAEVMLEFPSSSETTKWSARRTSVRNELSKLREKSQPVRAGKAIRLGTKQRAMTVPPLPSADVFWRGASVCVAQEDRTPATEMRCFDSARKKWGPKQKLAIPHAVPGEVVTIGGGDACDFRDVCWHSSLPKPEDPCAGVYCDELLAVLPGPRLVTFEGAGLVTVGARSSSGALKGGVSKDLLASLPGSLLAGGQLFFSGAMLVDASKDGRAWKPFEGVVERAWTVLVSPDRTHAVVSASPANPGDPITLWLVSLSWRTTSNELR